MVGCARRAGRRSNATDLLNVLAVGLCLVLSMKAAIVSDYRTTDSLHLLRAPVGRRRVAAAERWAIWRIFRYDPRKTCPLNVDSDMTPSHPPRPLYMGDKGTAREKTGAPPGPA